MKHKTAELEGANLDAAVTKANELVTGVGSWATYSSSWSHAGPIIEREMIAVMFNGEHETGWWMAGCWPTVSSGSMCDSGWLESPAIEMEHEQTGTTPLIAAMRAFVASKLGDEVELP